MTARPDFDRLLTAWLTESAGPLHAPSYLAETMDLVDRTPQRRAWPWSGVRGPLRGLRVDVRPEVRAVLLVTLLVLALIVAAIAGAFRTPSPIPVGSGQIVITTAGDITVVDSAGKARTIGVTPVDETMASWSPDGTRIAYWTWVIEALPDGSENISVALTVVAADGTDPVVVVDGVEPQIMSVQGPPQWSPDGRSLVFGSDAPAGLGGTIYRVGVDGTGLTALADDGLRIRSGPTWSPDGAWIAIRAAPLDSPVGPRSVGSVHVIRPDGSGETLVSGDTRVWAATFGPTWSADSRRVAYIRAAPDVPDGTSGHPDTIEIAVLGDAGWTRTALPDAGPLDDQVMMAWSPIGARLAYMRNNRGPTAEGIIGYELTVIDEDGKLRPITPEPLSQGFCWAPDGLRIAAITLDQRLVAFDVATGARLDDFGVADVNVGDACRWSAAAG